MEILTSPKYGTTMLSRQSRIRGKFIAQGLIRAIGAATYQNVLMENNEFLRNQSTIVVTGVRPELLEFVIDEEKELTIEDIMLKDGSIDSIELTTRSEDIGRVLVLTTRERFNQARKTIDTVLAWAGEQENFPESFRAEHHFPPKKSNNPKIQRKYRKEMTKQFKQHNYQ